jgi:hypothetical protein
MPLRPRHGRALNAAGFGLIVWLFTHAGSACLLGFLVTAPHAPAVSLVMGAMAGFCGVVVFTAVRALLAEVGSRYW